MLSRRTLVTFLLAALVCGCSQQVTQAPDPHGGGTETIGITGSVVDTIGAGVSSALVKLRRLDYLDTEGDALAKVTVFLANVQTDSTGRFSIPNVDTGAFTIEILSNGFGAAVACTVASAEARILLPPLVLRPTATIRGVVPEHDQFDSTRMQVCLVGFDHAASTGLNGEFVLTNVPTGTYTMHFVARASAYGAFDTTGISALPGETDDLGHVAFPQRVLGINVADSLAVAAILDSNGLGYLGVHQVSGADQITRRITELNLARLGVKRIPAIIGNLPALAMLNVEGDSLVALPPEIGMLAQLHDLNVGDNQLSALPPELDSCKLLYSLVATGNRLTSLPDGLGNLQNLHFIMAADNQIAALPATLVSWRPDFLSVSLDLNLLCTISTDQQSWLDQYSTDKGWRATQTCN